MTIAIRASMHAPILRAHAELGDWQSLANRLRSEHRATFDAIRRRDSVAAPDLIEEHIRSAYQSLPALHG